MAQQYDICLAKTIEQVDAAQRCRFNGFAPRDGTYFGREISPFDALPTTAHILLYAADLLVGTARLLGPNPEVAHAAGTHVGLELEQDYDLCPLLGAGLALCEVTGAVATFAGANGMGGGDDGNLRVARFQEPEGLALDGNNVYVGDTDNHTLHDMGDGLADGFSEFQATGRQWRTPPLWGIGLIQPINDHSFFLNDGRARG